MAILGRFKKGRVDEDEDDEIDDVDEDEDDDDEDDSEVKGGGLTDRLGNLRGLGKMGGAVGMLSKVIKRGAKVDDEDEEDDDEDSSAVSVAPAAALDLSENAGESAEAVAVASDASDASDAPVAAATEIIADSVPSVEEKKADYLDLGDVSEEKLEVDPILRDLALSQDDTTAGKLLDELTAFLNRLEKMASN